MKILATLSILTFIGIQISFCQKTILHGSLILKGKSNFTSSIQILSPSKSNSDVVFSEEDSKKKNFLLSFPSNEIGERVDIKIYTETYVFINGLKYKEITLPQTTSSDRLNIYVCSEKERNAIAMDFYNISKNFIKKTITLEQEKNFKRKTDSLKRIYENIDLYEIAEKLTIAKLEQSDSILNSAILSFENGDLEEAINILKRVDLQLELNDIKKSKEVIDRAINRRHLLAKMETLRLDYNSAKTALQSILEIDEYNVKAINGLGNIYYDTYDHDQAIIFFERGLRYVNNRLDSLTILMNLGSVKADEKIFHKALTIANYYKEVDSLLWSKISYNIHIKLGNVLFRRGHFEKAISEVRLGIKHLKRLVPLDTLKYAPSYAYGLNTIGGVYDKMGKVDSAMIYLKKSIKVWSFLSNLNHSHLKGMLKTRNNIAGIYSDDSSSYKDAEKIYLENDSLIHEIFDTDSTVLRERLSGLYLNLGILYDRWKKDSLAKFYLEKSIDHRIFLAHKYPSLFSKKLALAQYAAGSLFIGNPKYNFLSIRYLKKAIDSYKFDLSVNNKDSLISMVQLAKVFYNLGVAYNNIQEIDSLIFFFNKSFHQYVWAFKKKEKYKNILHETYKQLSHLFFIKNKYRAGFHLFSTYDSLISDSTIIIDNNENKLIFLFCTNSLDKINYLFQKNDFYQKTFYHYWVLHLFCSKKYLQVKRAIRKKTISLQDLSFLKTKNFVIKNKKKFYLLTGIDLQNIK